MRLKGIALSLDALLALAFVAVMLSLPLVISQSAADYAGFDELSILGRDYLTLKHFSNKTFTADNFTALTGHTLSENEPSDPAYQWVQALYYRYPNFFNCANSTSCSFSNSSSNASYGNQQDTGLTHAYRAWVRP